MNHRHLPKPKFHYILKEKLNKNFIVQFKQTHVIQKHVNCFIGQFYLHILR